MQYIYIFFIYLLILIFLGRHVILPPDISKSVPKNHLMTETEWRNLGVQQSPGWIHYMIHLPGECWGGVKHSFIPFTYLVSSTRRSDIGAQRDAALWQERSLVVRWVVGSIPHGVDPLSYFAFQPVFIVNLAFIVYWSEMQLRGKSVHSWCDGSSDRSFME